MINLTSTVCAFAVLSTLVACSQEAEVVQSDAAINAQTESATEFAAVLQPTEGNAVSGTVLFSSTENGVRVSANVNGLALMSSHGFHIHEFGDCSAADASSAGGHFNPRGQPHGAPDSAQRHVGDLGNIVSNGAGVAQTNMVDTQLSFSGMDSIVGKSVVIHAVVDDLETQPTGNAGARLACGVITAVGD